MKIPILRRVSILLILLSTYSLNVLSNDVAEENQTHTLINQLPLAKLRDLPTVVEQLSNVGDSELLSMFEAMLEGQLYYKSSDKSVVILLEEFEEDTFRALEVISKNEIDSINKNALKKIRVNNKIRGLLRNAIAKLTLFHPEKNQRLEAVERLMGDLNDGNVSLLKDAFEKEKDKKVSNLINIALNLKKLDSTESDIRKDAINEISGELHPVVRNKLSDILRQDDSGNYLEKDEELIVLAEKALKNIEGKLSFYQFIERLFFGLSLGSVLLLAAIGLSITFGVMGVINMAHGELLMLGAYTTYVIQLLMPNHIGLSIFVAIPAAFCVCALVGIAIERGVIRFLKGRPLETLLATFGISLILQQAVRSVFSPLNRQVSSPDWMSGTLQINPGLALTYNRLYIIIFSFIVFFILLLIIKRTSLGLYVRAVSQNRNMAKAVGIRSEWVDAMTFGLGSGIAGVAGVALSQLTNVGPNLGQSYIIDSFMVVVFGGVGNLWGTLVAAFSLGVTSKFLEPITGSVLAQIIVLVFIVLFIQKRPRGLFPQKGRGAE